MSRVRDGKLHRLTLHRVQDLEVRARMARRRRVWVTPALWLVAGLGALLAWFARSHSND